jgi:hypothetical protein
MERRCQAEVWFFCCVKLGGLANLSLSVFFFLVLSPEHVDDMATQQQQQRTSSSATLLKFVGGGLAGMFTSERPCTRLRRNCFVANF